MTQLIVEKVTKQYPTPGEPLVVLRGVDLALASGENLAIVGPSGSGKSTLLNIIGGLDKPSSGRVIVDEEIVTSLSERELASYRNRKIGFVFQDHHLLPQCTALENVLIPCLARGRPDRETVDWARYLLEQVGLANRADHRPGEMSGGERQRVALARAMVLRPTLILADEPTGNLDWATGELVAQLLLQLQGENQAILIVVTHSERLASLMSQRKRLESGTLVAC